MAIGKYLKMNLKRVCYEAIKSGRHGVGWLLSKRIPLDEAARVGSNKVA